MNENESIFNKKFWFKRYELPKWISNTLAIGFFAFIFYVLFTSGQHNIDYPARAVVTIRNLKTMRTAIRLYKQLTNGELPSTDLNELYTVYFNDGGVLKPILEDGVLPPELISDNDRRIQGNPSNRKVVNKVDNTGGWVYDPIAGIVEVNYNKPLDDEWEQYAGENPYQDW